MQLPYSVGQLTSDQEKLLTDMHSVLITLNRDIAEMRGEIQQTRHEAKRTNDKIFYAIAGSFIFGILAWSLPEKAQYSAQAWFTYASLGATLGVLFG